MKKSEYPLRKHTLNLYDGDLEELAVLFPDLPKTEVVRELVRSTIDRHKAAAPKPNLTEQVKI